MTPDQTADVRARLEAGERGFWQEIDRRSKREVAELLRHTQGERDAAVEKLAALSHGKDAEKLERALMAPCRWCGYNGQGYWQAGTHAAHCRWWTIGGEDKRLQAMRDSPDVMTPILNAGAQGKDSSVTDRTEGVRARMEAAARLRQTIRDRAPGCHMLSLGDQCLCGLCDIDRLAALSHGDAQQEKADMSLRTAARADRDRPPSTSPAWNPLERFLLDRQIATGDVRYQDAATSLYQHRKAQEDGFVDHGFGMHPVGMKCSICDQPHGDAPPPGVTDRTEGAREALLKYGRHFEGCPAKDAKYHDCNCGFTQVLAFLQPHGDQPPAETALDVESMRGNLHATFNGGHQTPETIRAFHHGMDTVCNVLAAKQKGEGTNGILPLSPTPEAGTPSRQRPEVDGEISEASFGTPPRQDTP